MHPMEIRINIMVSSQGSERVASSRDSGVWHGSGNGLRAGIQLVGKTVLKKRLRIIYLVKKKNTQYLKKTHKFGIEVPKSVVQAYALDKKNVHTLWADAISRDMKDVSPAFKKLDNGEIVPIGYQQINCQMNFDVEWKILGARLGW